MEKGPYLPDFLKGELALTIKTETISTRMMQFLYFSILISPWLPPIALLGTGIMALFSLRGKFPIKGWPETVFLGFIFLSIISWFFNVSWFLSIPVVVFPVVLFGLYYLLAVWIKHLKWTWKKIEGLYIQFLFLGIYSAVVTILQRIGWIPSYKADWTIFLGYYPLLQSQSIRSVGFTTNSNLTAAILVCLALISIYAMSVLDGKWKRAGALGLFFLFGVAIWCTGSRGAWVGLIVGLLVQVWMTGNRRRTVGILFGLLLLGIAAYINRNLIPRSETLVSTAKVRLFVWEKAFEIFQDNWLVGVLPLHFGEVFEQYTGEYLYHAHNILLGVAAEYGIFGLIIFTALIFITLVRARRWRKMAVEKKEKRLAGMLSSLLVAMMGHGMYDYPIISPQVGILFMLSIIFIHAQYEQKCLSLRQSESRG